MSEELEDITASSISIAGWVISVDSNGNLNFTSPQGSAFQLSQSGNLSLAGSLTAPSATVGGNGVITANMSIYIVKPIDGSVLNASTHGGSFGAGWKSTPYYRRPRVDKDSELQIGIYVAGQWPFAE